MTRLLALLILLLPAAARADEAKLPLTAGAPVADGDELRVDGTTAAGATVSLHAGAACAGDALDITTAGDDGKFGVAAKKAAGGVSLRARLGERRSDCVTPAAAAPVDTGLGICIGLATRCGVLPKGICYTQQGCMNPIGGGGFGNDRCLGTAKPCTSFNTKSSCFMQRGCTWAASKKK